MRSRKWIQRLAAGAAAAWGAGWSHELFAQLQVQGRVVINGRMVQKADGEVDSDAENAASFPQDRDTIRRMNKAEELLKEKNWTDGVLLLGAILEASEDYFYPIPDDPNSYRSVKSRVMELVGQMPEEGRSRYQLEYGFKAKRLLEEAVKEGGAAKLEEASRRFFHTDSGYEATYRLGLHHLDHGRPLAASLCLERLRRFPAAHDYEPVLSLQLAVCLCHVGGSDAMHRAVQVLREVKTEFGTSKITVAGRSLDFPAPDQIDRGWAEKQFAPLVKPLTPGQEEWVVHRGNAARNAPSVGGAPLLNPRWRVPVSNDQPKVDEVVDQVETNYLQSNFSIAPSLIPLAVKLDPKEASQLQISSIRSSRWGGLFEQLVAAESSPKPSPARRIWERLSAALKDDLKARPAGETPPRALRQRFVDEMNAMFERRDFYETESWKGIDALTEADQLLRVGLDKLDDAQVVRLNRVLFEAAFRSEVLRSFADVVLMRTYNNLLAVDFVTGKRVWQIPLSEEQDVLGKLLRSEGGGGVARNTGGAAVPLADRLWRDLTFGTLASDGRLVFSVEDLPIRTGGGNPNQMAMAVINRPSPATANRDFNRLAAHEIRTGKLVWEAGGSKGEGEQAGAGLFFLGPPLPLGGSLFGLAEANNEVRLVVLDGQTGAVQWTQNLAEAQHSLSEDPNRRQAGVSPAYSDGVLVCPTAAGAVVAVDLTSRSLLWGYRYAHNAQPDQGQNGFAFAVQNQARTNTSADRWIDSTPVLSKGSVLLTPTESTELHCLRLLDGSAAWKQPRQDGLYVACVYEDLVVVVGAREIRALRLSNGKTEWKTSYPDAASVPSGRGFLSENYYYLPLSTAEVATIDVRNGRVTARSKSRQNTIPGNLICFRGTVISQGARFLESFDELKGLEQLVAGDLKRNGNDPTALAQRGEILLQNGQVALAIADFRRSLDLKFDPRTLGLLVDSLLEGLRVDFASNRSQADEVLRLVEKLPEDQRRVSKSRYLRAVATGLQRLKENVAAFKTYLRFTDPDVASPELERVEGVWSVRSDRWVQARLAELFNASSPDERASMEKEVALRLDEAMQGEGADALERFMNFFGAHPSAHRGRLELARRWIAAGQWLKGEFALRAIYISANSAERPAATYLLADLYRQASRPREAAVYYRELAGPLADVVCWQGLTGKEWIAKLGVDDPVRGQLASGAEWPTGVVKSERIRGSSYAAWRYLPIEMKGRQEPFFGPGSILLDQQQRRLIGRDGFGKQVWEANPVDERDRFQHFGMNAFAISAYAFGHVALISTGQHVIAVDTITPNSQQRILWKEPLVQSVPGLGMNPGLRFNFIARGRKQRLVAQTMDGQPIGPVGPLTSTYAAFVRRKELAALDPLTGKPLWIRHDVQSGGDLFGDDEYLVCIPPDSTKATVYRALDGQPIGIRDVGGEDQRLECIGRSVLRWRRGGAQEILELYDLAKDEVSWSRKYNQGAKASMSNSGEEVGVMQPDGKVEILAVAGGKPIVEHKVDPEANLSEIFLMRSVDRFLLIANRPYVGNNQLILNGVNGNIDNPLVNGAVHGFERGTGKHAWSRKVENQAIQLRQLPELPVLAMAVRTQRRQGNSFTNESEILCLDKRNGRVVFQESLKNEQINGFDVEASPENKTMEIKLTQSVVKLTFTSDPLPPEAKESPKKKEEKEKEDD